MPVALETERLFLRPMGADDLDALARVLCDPETMRHYPAPFDRFQVQQWIDRNERHLAEFGCSLYSLVLKQTGEVIGDCGLSWKDVDGQRELEIGYHVRRDLWGRGLATESARACLQDGFTRIGVKRIIALIRPENLQSRRVAEKIGMAIDRPTTWAQLPHYVYVKHSP